MRLGRGHAAAMPFHCNSSLLAPGSILLPGNFGRIVRHFWNDHPAAQREALLERVRAAEFPSAPTRFECTFVSDSMIEVDAYLGSLGAVAAGFLVAYEVELADPSAPRLVTDHRRVARPPSGYDEPWARQYWRGDFLPPAGPARCAEVLTLSPLMVVRQVPTRL